MTINIDLSKDGIDKLRAELKAYEDYLKRGMENLVTIAADEAADYAEYKYLHDPAYAGSTDGTTVTATKDSPTSATVTASGPAVLYQEFGSGVFFPDDYPDDVTVAPAELPHSRGTQGKLQGRNKTWVYKGKQGAGGIPMKTRKGRLRPGIYMTYGNPALKAMYNARKNVGYIWIEDLIEEAFK